MKGLIARGARAALLACVLFAVRAEAEMSLELFAGGKHYQATPGTTIPVSPNDLSPGPNGTLIVVDAVTGKILSFDPATSAVTTLPDYPDYPEGPAAFACTRTFCSLPVTDASAIPAQLDRLQRALSR